MLQSGVAGYAAINARVRILYAELLDSIAWGSLLDAPDFNILIGALKRTGYGPYLESVKDKDLTARRVVFQLKSRLAASYTTIIQTSPGHVRPLLAQLYRHFEVDNLKAVLRGIVIGATWERVRYVLFPIGSFSSIPAEAMVETGNVASAIELLRGTPYYDTLSHAMKRYTVEQTLFPLEVVLDLFYWRELWNRVKQLSNQDRTQAMRVLGSLIDMDNLLWAIRYKVYHKISEEELINYTLPFGYRVQDEDIRSIAAGGDIARIVTRMYPDIANAAELLQEPDKTLPTLELEIQRHIARQCKAAFLGDPFHIGIPLAYLILNEWEIQDLTVLIEAKSAGLESKDYRPYLIRNTQD